MDVKQFWDQHLIQDVVLNPYYQKFVDFALPLASVGRALRVVDLGCGNGLLSIHIAQRYGFSVTGIDIS